MLTISKWIVAASSIILGTILWLLSSLDPPCTSTLLSWPYNTFIISSNYEYIYSHKGMLGLTASCLQASLVVLTLGLGAYNKRRILKRLIQEVLNKALFEVASTAGNETFRVTLFQKVGPLYAFFRFWFVKCILTNFFKLSWIKLYNNIKEWRMIPWFFPVRKYLVIYQRVEPLVCEDSTIFFRVPEPYEKKKFEGFVPFIWNSRQMQHIDLPDITNIDLSRYESYYKLPGPYKKRIRDYMIKGKITVGSMEDGLNFKKLKCIRRQSTELWGTPIFSCNEKGNSIPWGVLVIDSDGSQTLINPDLIKKLCIFASSVETIISQ